MNDLEQLDWTADVGFRIAQCELAFHVSLATSLSLLQTMDEEPYSKKPKKS